MSDERHFVLFTEEAAAIEIESDSDPEELDSAIASPPLPKKITASRPIPYQTSTPKPAEISPPGILGAPPLDAIPSKIYLPFLSFQRRLVASPQRRITIRDASALPFIIEEFLAEGVANIVVPENDELAAQIARSPDFIRNRITITSEAASIHELVRRHIEPLVRDRGGELEGHGPSIGGYSYPDGVEQEAIDSIVCTGRNMATYLMGFHFQSGVNVNAGSLYSGVKRLRRISSIESTRLFLAALEGVLSRCHPVAIDGPALTDPDDAARRRVLQELLDDSEYKTLQRSRAELGVIGKLKPAAEMIPILARRIVSKPLFSRGLKIVRSASSLFFGKDVPDVAALGIRTTPGYVPPAIDFSGVLKRAQQNWVAAKPAPIPLCRLDEAYLEAETAWPEVDDGRNSPPSNG